MIETEILIMGAGPAGASAALALSKANIPSVLVDKATFPRDKICGDALSGKVMLSLQRLQQELPKELKQSSNYFASYGVTFVAPNGKSLSVPFRQQMKQDDPPGYIARRIDFDNWLFSKASEAQGVTVQTGLSLTKYEKDAEGWRVYSATGQLEFKAKVLVVADGAQSRFVRSFLKEAPVEAHICAGLRVYYKGVKGLSEQGYVELHFLKDVLPGYFWIFPLPDGSANVGLGIRSDVIRKKKLNLKQELQKIISTHPNISPRFIGAVAEGPVHGYGLPLGSVKRSLSGDGYLLLGDAGSLIDPFTGEGIGNGMISGLKAAEVISKLYPTKHFNAAALVEYDQLVYKRLWPELNLSARMQALVNHPWLFNMIVNKAAKSKTLRETISCMFDDIDMRGRLKDPRFYLKVLMD